jgi:phospholipid/cholesterol/gamma-HCH transport system substrate-binding protein
MRLLRNTDEWVGLLVVLSIVLFIAAVLHAGLLSDWFRPTANLRVLLPETGSAGLAAGADIEVLGTRVGTVRRITVDPNQRLYAVAELDEEATGFIRRDSQAVIKKSFGVAGAAFLDIAKGNGAPLDWHFAVIEAVTERDPTESIGAMVDQVKEKIFPVLDDAGRTMKALADTAQAINEGHGNIGRLVKDEDLVNQITPILTNLKTSTDQLAAEISDIRAMTASVTGPDGVPALLKHVDASLASVQAATHDLAAATPRLPPITRSVDTTLSTLPALLTQAQQTVADLEKLSVQLRHTWPLSGSAGPEPRRLSPGEVKP